MNEQTNTARGWPPNHTMPSGAKAIWDGAINVSSPVECWQCKNIKPPFRWINVAPDAANGGLMKPMCQECSQ